MHLLESFRSSLLTSTKLLKQLSWLSIEWQILLQYCKPAKSTRSSASHSLSVRAAQPFIWFSCMSYSSTKHLNALHSGMPNTDFIQTSFKDYSTYPTRYRPSSMRPESLLRRWRCIGHLPILSYLLIIITSLLYQLTCCF